MSKLGTPALILALSGLCVLVTLAASLIASRRPASERLDTHTRSFLTADYSADRLRPRLAPLSPAIINAAAQDSARLDATEIRITPRNDTPTGSSSSNIGPSIGGSTPTSGEGTVSPPGAAQPPAGVLPTATLAPGEPASTPLPGALTATPEPNATQAPTATLAPGVTPTNTPPSGSPPAASGTPGAAVPTATSTLTPTATATPTSTPVPTPTATPVPTATPITGYTPLIALPCALPGSLVSAIKSEILFDNRSSQTVRIFWVNALGVAQDRGTLAPGQQRHFDTFATHSWVVRDLQGNCIAGYTLAIVPGLAVIN